MEYKRITLLSGHYGSGKTNAAVNIAYELGKVHDNVVLADLDIVNPYFRSKDSEKDLAQRGVRLVCSNYANSNLDVPALPQEIYALTDDRTIRAVIDVGGDERGALALGRISDRIREEDDYEMYLVINRYRPLTRDVESVLAVMREIEDACRLPFTAILNNSNLGAETDEGIVLDSLRFADEVSMATGLPVAATCVDRALYEKLKGRVKNLFPLDLQKRPV